MGICCGWERLENNVMENFYDRAIGASWRAINKPPAFYEWQFFSIKFRVAAHKKRDNMNEF